MGALLTLGMTLAGRGILARVSVGICVFTTVVAAVVAMTLGGRGPQAPVHDVPIVASSALAWGGGFLLAFSASAHALRRDRKDGIRALVDARTRSLRSYLVARIGGLAALVGLVEVGGTLVTGLVSVAAAASAGTASRATQATLSSLVFAAAFTAVVSPLAFGALGARSRVGGYLFLLGFVVVPEILVGSLGSLVPSSVAELLSIPSALSALRAALSPGTAEIARFVRALLALAVFVVLATALVRREVLAVEREIEP